MSELDRRCAADSHPLALVNSWARTSRGRRFRSTTPSRTRRPARATSSVRPRPIDAVLTAEDALGLLERKEVSGAELHRVCTDAVAEQDGELHCHLHRRAGGGGRRPDRAQGRDLDEGRRDDRRLEDPRRLRPCLRRHCGRALPRRRPAGDQGERTRTSSRWAPRRRTPPMGRPTTPGIRPASPVAPAAAPQRRSPRGSRPGGSAPTPAARSSSRRRSATTSACGRPTA